MNKIFGNRLLGGQPSQYWLELARQEGPEVLKSLVKIKRLLYKVESLSPEDIELYRAWAEVVKDPSEVDEYALLDAKAVLRNMQRRLDDGKPYYKKVFREVGGLSFTPNISHIYFIEKLPTDIKWAHWRSHWGRFLAATQDIAECLPTFKFQVIGLKPSSWFQRKISNRTYIDVLELHGLRYLFDFVVNRENSTLYFRGNRNDIPDRITGWRNEFLRKFYAMRYGILAGHDGREISGIPKILMLEEGSTEYVSNPSSSCPLLTDIKLEGSFDDMHFI